jgi:hypothetical protein
LRGRARPCDRTAIHGTITPKRSTAPNSSDGLFVKADDGSDPHPSTTQITHQ